MTRNGRRVPGPQRPFTGLPGHARPRLARPALSWAVELIRLGIERRAGRAREGMIVPAVGVIPGDDHGGVLPARLLLQEVDQRDGAGLLVQRIGVAGMAVLIGGQLDERHRREVAGLHRVVEVLQVILVVGRIGRLAVGLKRVADRRLERTRARVGRVGGRCVILEPVVMRDVVDDISARPPSNACCACSRWCRSRSSFPGRSRP